MCKLYKMAARLSIEIEIIFAKCGNLEDVTKIISIFMHFDQGNRGRTGRFAWTHKKSPLSGGVRGQKTSGAEDRSRRAGYASDSSSGSFRASSGEYF